MRVLAITPIFPNRLEPAYGPFNRQQFKALSRQDVELRVLCAVPYLPGAGLVGVPKRTALLSKLDKEDVIEGIETRYLRRLYVPVVGIAAAMPLYLGSLLPHRDLVQWADVVLATWAYADGCASVLFAHAHGKPCAVKVHGTDTNVIAKLRTARVVLKRVLPRADAVVTVSRKMSDDIADLGVGREKIHLVPNGVDRALFGAQKQAHARRELSLPVEGPLVLFVGRVEPQKGIGELLEAFEKVHAKRPDVTLALVGNGVWVERAKEARARFAGKLVVTGGRPHGEIPSWMAAADVFTLPSHNEGTPNVVLEALATGRPVVATAVGGIPDALADPASGILVPPQDAGALADGLLAALERTWSISQIRACAPVSWDESARQLRDVLGAILGTEGS